jgi:hypothetical protein
MLGLLRVNEDAQANSIRWSDAIIDDRRALNLSLAAGQGRVPATVMRRPFRPLPARGSVLNGPFHAAAQCVAGKPFAFSIEYIANGLTARGTTVSRWITWRCRGGLIAARPITDWKRKKFSAA